MSSYPKKSGRFEMLTKMSIPVIALNCPEGPAGIDTILVNDRESVAKVIAHHGEQGHKKSDLLLPLKQTT